MHTHTYTHTHKQVPWVFERPEGKAKARAGEYSDAKRKVAAEAFKAEEITRLQALPMYMWTLLTEGLARQAKGLTVEDLRAAFTLEQFTQLLAKTEADSWHLAPGVVPAPTALYCEALAGLGEESEEVSGEAMGVLVGVLKHLKEAGEDGEEEGDEGEEGGYSVEEVAAMASDLLPTFEGRVLYPTISTIPRARYGWPPNCEVLFVGPGLEATLVATQDIASGEGLMFGEEVNDDEGGEGDGEGEESDEDEEFGEEEEEAFARPPKRAKRTR
jgi:hypothetical protein